MRAREESQSGWLEYGLRSGRVTRGRRRSAGSAEPTACRSSTAAIVNSVSDHSLEIIANARIVSSKTLSTDGRRLCASLTTVEFAPSGRVTRLRSTTQVASFIGAAMIDGHKAGHAASLSNLVQDFALCNLSRGVSS